METTLGKTNLERAEAMGWGPHSGTLDPFKQSVLKQYAVGKILDCGCATGLYSHFLQSNHSSVISVDLDHALLAKAKSRGVRHPIKASCVKLPFKAKTFDTTILFDVLEHVDEAKTLKELLRITKKRLILTVPRTTDKSLSKNFLVFGHHLDVTHLRTYSSEEARDMLKRHRLKEVTIEPCHPLSTDAIFLEILKGPLMVKRLLRKLVFTMAGPQKFYSNLLVMADIA